MHLDSLTRIFHQMCVSHNILNIWCWLNVDFFSFLCGSLMIVISDIEEAWRKRSWFRSFTRDGRERYWSFDSLCTRRKGVASCTRQFLMGSDTYNPLWFQSLITHSLFFFLFIFILNNQIKVVKQYLGYFPSIQLSATVSPITRTVLKVTSHSWLYLLFLIPWTYFL